MSGWAFGDMLRHMREQMNIGLREAAKRLTVDPGSLSKMENGLHAPPKNRSDVLRIARKLNLSEEWTEMLVVAARKFHVDAVYERFEK